MTHGLMEVNSVPSNGITDHGEGEVHFHRERVGQG